MKKTLIIIVLAMIMLVAPVMAGISCSDMAHFNPVYHFNFSLDDTGCNATDTDVTAFWDSVVGSPTYNAVTGVALDGNDGLKNTDTDFMNWGTGSFTYCMNTSANTGDRIAEKIFSHYGAGDTGIRLLKETNGAVWRTYIKNTNLATDPAGDIRGKYFYFCHVRNATHSAIFVNGVFNISVANTLDINASANFNLGMSQSEDAFFQGFVTDFTIFRYALSNANISDLYAHDFPLPPPPANDSVIDLLFSNVSHSETFKTSFDEGENFWVWINWTDLNTAEVLNESVGFCNITVLGALEEIIGNATAGNRTICNSGCDIDTNETREITFETAVNAVNDSVHFDICHEQTASGNLEVFFVCGAASDSVVVSAAEIPSCPTTAFIRVVSDACIAGESINFSQIADIPFSQRKRILNINFDREYSSHTDTYANGTVIFNSTAQLWQLNHTVEFYAHGEADFWANCTHNNTDFDDNVSESVTIVNIPPQIFIEQVVMPDESVITLEEGIIIEFQNGTWHWLISVVDDDIDFINYSWYNSSQDLLFSASANGTPESVNVSGFLFVDFDGMPFSVNVTANDTFGNVTVASLTFNVSDTADPSCNFSDVFVEMDVNFSFNVLCEDANFYTLNVTCPANDRSFAIDGLNVEQYLFIWNTTFNVSDTCTYIYCDGHTAPELKQSWDVKDKGELEFIMNSRPIGRFWVDRNDVLQYDYEIKSGKIGFGFSVDDKSIDNYFTAYYNVSPDSHYFKSDKWTAWIVDTPSRTAFDLNNLGEDVTVVDRGNGLWELSWVSKKRSFNFESITELNCVSNSFEMTAAFEESFTLATCPANTAEALSLWLVGFIALFLISWGFLKAGIFGFLGSLMLMVLSWYIVGCISIIGTMLAFTSFILLIWFVVVRPFGNMKGLMQ